MQNAKQGLCAKCVHVRVIWSNWVNTLGRLGEMENREVGELGGEGVITKSRVTILIVGWMAF